MTADQAVQEWIRRRFKLTAGTPITDVRFRVGAGWPGTDVTPGEPDFCAIRFREGGEEHELALDGTPPAQIIAEALAIYEEAAVALPTASDTVENALRHVEGAHWGRSRIPVSSLSRRVSEKWVTEARVLAAEVRRLRELAGLRSVGRSSRAADLLQTLRRG